MLRPRLRLLAGSAVLAALAFASVAQADLSLQFSDNAAIGHAILTDASGMTLYHFSQDTPGVSTCIDACATVWPPVTADALPQVDDPTIAGTLGQITRDDGSQQLTYLNEPLYYFKNDTQAGDATGQGKGGGFFVVDAPNTTATPAAAATPPPSAAATPTPITSAPPATVVPATLAATPTPVRTGYGY
jgi:predicted lipoprotein with Yx(FWY)xxD motif